MLPYQLVLLLALLLLPVYHAGAFPWAPWTSIIGAATTSSGTGALSTAAVSKTPVPHSNFVPHVYQMDEGHYFLVRQVPGDGGCLFHALTVCLDYWHTTEHRDFDVQLHLVSNKLRRLAVLLLKRDNDTLVMDNNEAITSKQLLAVVANHYKMTPQEYCTKMMLPETWGGGPEIVVISNHLKRPVHVYELSGHGIWNRNKDDINGSHKFKMCAKFGSPRFDKNAPPLNILCADGRFPNIKPGKHKKIGDHFLALFPCDEVGKIIPQSKSQTRRRNVLWWNELGTAGVDNEEEENRLRGGRR